MDNEDESLAPEQVDGQFQFQPQQNVPVDGFSLWPNVCKRVGALGWEWVSNWRRQAVVATILQKSSAAGM